MPKFVPQNLLKGLINLSTLTPALSSDHASGGQALAYELFSFRRKYLLHLDRAR